VKEFAEIVLDRLVFDQAFEIGGMCQPARPGKDEAFTNVAHDFEMEWFVWVAACYAKQAIDQLGAVF
jgi:hypothetical protein